MSKSLIYAVHGFMGQSADWDQVKINLPTNFLFQPIDLFKKSSPKIEPFENYSINPSAAERKIFVGYSLGGRFGLHLLAKHPEVFDHYVFLSTNPGMDDQDEAQRRSRYEVDELWSQQISEDNWFNFCQRWNAQSVFDRSVQPEPVRKLQDFDLNKLKESLTVWSLAKQNNMNNVIQMNQSKITWVVGSEDSKYCKIAEDLKQKKILLDYKRIFSGHRILFDNSKAVAELLLNLN